MSIKCSNRNKLENIFFLFPPGSASIATFPKNHDSTLNHPGGVSKSETGEFRMIHKILQPKSNSVDPIFQNRTNKFSMCIMIGKTFGSNHRTNCLIAKLI